MTSSARPMNLRRFHRVLVAAAASGLLLARVGMAQDSPAPQPTPLPGLAYDVPFFPNAKNDPNVPTPDSLLGFPVGSRPATHAQIEAVVKALAAKSPRCKLFEYGKTHEGRALYYLVIASEANLNRLDSLKADLAKLADPRKVSKEEGDRLAANLPAVAWMAYVIHGDEMSGSDASMAVAYHLAAGIDADVTNLLENLVVIIDPLMNPDGRDRFLTMMAQNRTVQPSVDDQSLLHSGFWPSGRMNHYLFDMNRDYIFATQPETRGPRSRQSQSARERAQMGAGVRGRPGRGLRRQGLALLHRRME
jgi:zinc carboxypeptidase